MESLKKQEGLITAMALDSYHLDVIQNKQIFIVEINVKINRKAKNRFRRYLEAIEYVEGLSEGFSKRPRNMALAKEFYRDRIKKDFIEWRISSQLHSKSKQYHLNSHLHS